MELSLLAVSVREIRERDGSRSAQELPSAAAFARDWFERYSSSMARFNEDLTNLEDVFTLAEANRRIRKTLSDIEVLDDLSHMQRNQIVESVFLATRNYQTVRNPPKRQRRAVGFTEREVGRLHTRVKRLQKAFDELVAEADAIAHQEGFWAWIRGDFVAGVLDEVEDRVDALRPSDNDGSVPPSVPTVQDVRFNGSVLLQLMFEHCGIRRGRASWRVARIENTFWGGSVRETDEDTNRKRSSAILKRLFRRKRPR